MSALRQRIIARLYGDGLAAFVAAALTDRAISAARSSLRKEPETLDVSRLRPGETYQIVTRPAPGRKLRSREAELVKVEERLARVERPGRRQRRAERRLARRTRQLRAAEPGTRRFRRVDAEQRALRDRVDRLATPDARTVRLRARRDRLAADVARRQAAAMTRVQRRARPPRRSVFR